MIACVGATALKSEPEAKLSPAQALDAWHTVQWGYSDTGGFAYSILAPKIPGQNGWGVHFFQGYLGYFYRTDFEKDIFERLVWRQTKFQNAVDALRKELGIDLEDAPYLNGF